MGLSKSALVLWASPQARQVGELQCSLGLAPELFRASGRANLGNNR